jgi:alpha-amylase
MTKDPENKIAIAKSTPEKILARVSYANGFHFFESIGRYTGETAISLEHFAAEIEFVPVESIEFHFKRGDFQKWIASTIGDGELAGALGRIEAEPSGELLRKRILEVLNARIVELKSQFQSKIELGNAERNK